MNDTSLSTAPAKLDADYRSTVEFRASPERVFHALTTAAELTAWWAPASGSGLAGGELQFLFGTDPLIIRVDTAERPRIVSWTAMSFEPLPDWVGTTISFDVTPTQSGGSRLHFRHAGMTPQLECFDTCAAGWQQALASLLTFVDSGKGNAFGSTTDTRAEHWQETRENPPATTAV